MPTPTIHTHQVGLSWVMAGETMQRACHALNVEGKVWLVDPIDAPEPLERAAALGTPAGVVQLLDRHERDGEAIAARLGVPFSRLPSALPDTPFEVVSVIDRPKWRELALWWPGEQTLIVSEAVGTADYFAVGEGGVGVHPMLRAFGVSALRDYAPELLLVGHGAPYTGPDTAGALTAALDRSRSDLPKLLGKLPGILRGG